MIARIQIYLAEDERAALQDIAAHEMRGLREQARFIIRSELERRGLLTEKPAADPKKRTEG